MIETYLYAKIDNENWLKTHEKSSLDKNVNRQFSSDSSYFSRKLWNIKARVDQWLDRRLYTAQAGGSIAKKNISLHEYIPFCQPHHTLKITLFAARNNVLSREILWLPTFLFMLEMGM